MAFRSFNYFHTGELCIILSSVDLFFFKINVFNNKTFSNTIGVSNREV